MKIRYTDLIPCQEDLFKLYDDEGWNDFLKLPKEALHQAMIQSWYVVSAYDENQLIECLSLWCRCSPKLSESRDWE
jgi:hypothetical protein